MSALIEAQRKQIEKLEKALKYSQDKNVALNVLRKRVNHLRVVLFFYFFII